jgi:hypothetical protein
VVNLGGLYHGGQFGGSISWWSIWEGLYHGGQFKFEEEIKVPRENLQYTSRL